MRHDRRTEFEGPSTTFHAPSAGTGVRPRRSGLRGTIAAFSVLLPCLSSASGLAGTLAWPSEPYDYVIVDQDIHEILADFGKNLNVKIQVDEDIEGRVRGDWPKQPPRPFLEAMAQRFGFDWYFDGHILHVTATAKSQTLLLFLGPVPFEELRSDLTDLDILDKRFPLRFSPGSNLALVAGPPRYVEMVTETLAALSSRPQAPDKPAKRVTVFRGPGRQGS